MKNRTLVSPRIRMLKQLRVQIQKVLSEIPLIHSMSKSNVSPVTEEVFNEMLETYLIASSLYKKKKLIPEFKKLDFHFSRVTQMRFPQPELYSLEMFRKGFRIPKDVLPTSLNITKEDVFRADKDNINKHSRYKPVYVDTNYIDAIDHLIQELEPNRSVKFTRLNSQNFVDEIGKFNNTSSCYPKYSKKHDPDSIEECYKTGYESISEAETIEEMWEHMSEQPTTIFHRFTPKLRNLLSKDKKVEIDVKKRSVFGMPMSVVTLESCLYRNVDEYLKRESKYWSYYNKRIKTGEEVNAVRKNLRIPDFDLILAGDIEQIDANLSHFTILLILCILQVYSGNTDRNSKEWKVAKTIQLYYMFTPVVGSFGSSVTTGGHITGSYLTSIVSSFAVLIAVNGFKWRQYRSSVQSETFRGLGDDFIIAMKHSDVILLTEEFRRHHMFLNRTKVKTTFHEESLVHYLGFDWNVKGEPKASPDWILSRCIYPERYVDIPGYIRTYIRVCSIIFQSVDGEDYFKKTLLKYDDYFRQVVFRKQNPLITYFDKEGSLFQTRVPLNDLLRYGWKMF